MWVQADGLDSRGPTGPESSLGNKLRGSLVAGQMGRWLVVTILEFWFIKAQTQYKYVFLF